MPEDRGTLRQVAWTELFPWLDLLRVFRMAIQARFLLLSAAAVLLTFAGWWVAGKLFGVGDNDSPRAGLDRASGRRGRWLNRRRDGADAASHHGPSRRAVAVDVPGLRRRESAGGGLAQLKRTIRQLFAPDLTLVGLAYLLVCGLWVDLVWAFFGGVITRLVALQYTRSERGSLRAAVRYVTSRYLAYVTAPLFPLFGVLLFVLPVAIVGLVGHAGSFGLAAVALLWPLFLVAGLVIVIFLAGLLFGWPLMWPTIAPKERTASTPCLVRTRTCINARCTTCGLPSLPACWVRWERSWCIISRQPSCT